MAFDNPLLTGSRDEFESSVDSYLPAGWYFDNDDVDYGQIPTDIDGPPLDKWWFERFDILFDEYMKEYMKDIEGQDSDDTDRIYRQEAADAWVDALIKYEAGEITLEELKEIDVGVLSEMDGWDDYYEAVINDAGAENTNVDDDQGDDNDGIFDKIIDGVVTVINGVKGILGPTGIFIPFPGSGSGTVTGGSSGSGENSDGSGETTSETNETTSETTGETAGNTTGDTGAGTNDTGSGTNDTGSGAGGTTSGTSDTGSGTNDTGSGAGNTGSGSGAGNTGSGSGAGNTGSGTGNTGSGAGGNGNNDDDGNGDVTVINGGGGGTVKDPEDNRCDCGGYKGYKNAEGGCDCPSGTVDDPVGDDDGRCDCGGYKGYKDENGDCQCPGDVGYDPVGDSETKGGGGGNGGVVVGPSAGGDDGLEISLFGIPSAPTISRKSPTQTKFGPLFKVPRSRPYTDQDDGSRPIAGWLQQLGRNLK